jgi:cis-3-alkyl-4-acyloxetan-2-one decarboxylase
MVTPTQIPTWLAPLYPFKPQTFVTAGGARMSFLDEGPRSDEAVLMLHGNPTWSFYYRDLIRALSPTMRCVAPDHIGMGLSEKPEAYDYTLATRIADIEALVAKLGLRRVHLVVHDWGGAIGFGFAARHPELIGRLVILNTAVFPAPRMPARIALCRMPVLGPWLVRGRNAFAERATRMAMGRRALTVDERRAYLLPYDSWANRVAVNAFVRDIPMRPSDPSWDELTKAEQGLKLFRDRPALIMWGGKDFCFDQTFLARWREIFPEASAHLIPDGGHYVIDDAPAEALPLIVEFLQGRLVPVIKPMI